MAQGKLILDLMNGVGTPRPTSETTPYTGNWYKLYFETNNQLVLNGDGSGTTDFINPTDGLAQYWNQLVNL